MSADYFSQVDCEAKYSRFKVAALKKELARLRLPTSGRKSVLVDRLVKRAKEDAGTRDVSGSVFCCRCWPIVYERALTHEAGCT